MPCLYWLFVKGESVSIRGKVGGHLGYNKYHRHEIMIFWELKLLSGCLAFSHPKCCIAKYWIISKNDDVSGQVIILLFSLRKLNVQSWMILTVDVCLYYFVLHLYLILATICFGSVTKATRMSLPAKRATAVNDMYEQATCWIGFPCS